MNRFIYADADGRGSAERRRQRDLEFLAALRVATDDDLAYLARRYNTKHAPKWKRIAIQRATEKRGTPL